MSAEQTNSAGLRFSNRPETKTFLPKKIKGLMAWILRIFGSRLFLYIRARVPARTHMNRGVVFMLVLLSMTFVNHTFAESSTSPSYRLDYARFTNDSDRKVSSSYTLVDSISDVSVEGSSSGYNLRNVYSAGVVAGGPICGNNIIETGEQCEGTDFNGLVCSNYGFTQGSLQCVSCQIVTTSCFNEGGNGGSGGGGFICGNGIREASEQCDDGNTLGGDGCSSYCFIEANVCGNGIKEIGEQCDDGNVNTGDGCTPSCILEGTVTPPPTTPPTAPPTPEPPLVFEPEFNPDLVFSFPAPEVAPKITPTTAPKAPPLKPAAPKKETTMTHILSKFDYHFDNYGPGQIVTVLDETPFVVTQAEPNAVYEMIIFDENDNVMTRQGVQSTPDGILMFESIPPLDYKTYGIALFDQNRKLFKAWTITIEDRKYRLHDNFYVNDELNREYIALGTFEKVRNLSGNGKPNTKYHAYLQKIEKQGKKVSEITHLTTTADENGNYRLELPEKLKDGSYLMHVVQVYEDGKIQRNKRYIFDIQSNDKTRNIWILLMILIVFTAGRIPKKEKVKKKPTKEIKRKRGGKRGTFITRSLLSVITLIGLFSYHLSAFAAVTTPAVFIYEGKLLDSTNTPITTSQTFRFSLWNSDDLVAGDIIAGAINSAAPAYSGWSETHTLTPNTDGTFFAELGSITPLPNMLLTTHTHLMVEIKVSGALDTSYELMDPTGDAGADTNDRQTVGSTPYTNNADFIDNAEVGTGVGDIATLGLGSLWNINYIPGGTNADSWTIDNDNTVGAGGTIDLVFGNTLAQFLQFDITNDWFKFSNALVIDSNDVNTAPILTLENTAGDLQFFRSDATPEGIITGSIGDFTIDGTNGNAYIKNSGSSTNTGWLQIGGLTAKNEVFHTEYEDSTIQGDGSSNKGLLNSYFVDAGGTNKYNYYEWTTREPTIQDVDITISFRLPKDFQSFTATPLSILYKTGNGVITTNQIDVALYDTTGTAVSLTGGTDLASAAWATASITFGGVPTFTAGDVITLIIKPQTTNAGYARVSDVIFNYNGT